MDHSVSDQNSVEVNTESLTPSEAILFHPDAILSRRRPWGIAIFCLGFVMSGVLCSYFGTKSLLIAIDSYNWPSTKGTIIESKLRTGCEPEAPYGPSVTYKYLVDTKKYSAARIDFGGGWCSSSRNSAMEIINSYPAGSQVNVFYKSENPTVAALEPGLNIFTIIPLLLGIIFILVGISVFIANRKLLFQGRK